MRSSGGAYFIGLDHVRACAAFMVFAYHFNYVNSRSDAPAALFPLSILGEGHIGVPLFMALSGYLFARLLDGKRVIYMTFLWNRLVRLVPLLMVVFLVEGISRWVQGQAVDHYLQQLINGVLLPTWPNGGWSITVEAHFYLILPLLLLLSARRPSLLLLTVLAALTGRYLFWQATGEVQSLSYWTILGGIDSFVFGIVAHRQRAWIVGRHGVAAALLLAVAVFAWLLDSRGGFYFNEFYAGGTALWVVYPTVLGGCFGFLIAWYDGSFRFRETGPSRWLAKIGEWSYSIYLLHFFVVFEMRAAIEAHVISLDNDLVRFGVALLAFVCFLPLAWLSHRLIERPALRLRRNHLRPAAPPPAAAMRMTPLRAH